MKISNIACLILAVGFLSGCFSIPGGEGLPVQVPPKNVRLKGTIINFQDNFPPDSCSNCWALVKVDSVEGFGAKARVMFSGDTITVRFMYTLEPYILETTEKTDTLPGLKLYDSFRGDIEILTGENGKFDYRVYRYLKW
jgi:hypothetical protein